MVYELWFGIGGLGFGIWGLGCRSTLYRVVFRVSCVVFRVAILDFITLRFLLFGFTSHLELAPTTCFRVQDLVSVVSCFGFLIQGLQ